MAKQGKATFIFECADCKEKIRLTLYFGDSKIWNNTTSPTLQKLEGHEEHRVVLVSYQFARV